MKKGLFSKQLVAPCGINCGVCMVYLREKKPCSGCRSDGKSKMKSCINCDIKSCEYLAQTKSKFCYECERYPCIRLKQLDKRYRKGYNFSLIENLEKIKAEGIKNFLENETVKWKCSSCGAILCVHKTFCLMCNHPIE